MTLLRKITLLVVVSAVVALPASRQLTRKTADKSVMQFAITDFLEKQSADNVYRLTKSTGKELEKLLRTPEVPSDAQLARQKFQDWFCRLEGSPLRKVAQVATATALFPVTLGAWILAATTPDYRTPTMSEQASHAAFSLGALAVQTYLTERAGLDSTEPLTINDVLDIVKNFARKQARSSTSKADMKAIIKQIIAEEQSKRAAATQEQKEDMLEEADESLQEFFS